MQYGYNLSILDLIYTKENITIIIKIVKGYVMFGFGLFDGLKNANMGYDKSLINEYKKDHKKLVVLLTKITKEKEKKNIRKLLSTFKIDFLGHLISEDMRLYKYLIKYYENNEYTLSLILEYQKSIKVIQKEVLFFVDSYLEEKAVFGTIFKRKLANVVSSFLARITTEENNLYTLYIK